MVDTLEKDCALEVLAETLETLERVQGTANASGLWDEYVEAEEGICKLMDWFKEDN